MIKVIDNALKNKAFGELKVGEAFKYGDNYLIKIPPVSDCAYNYNAVNLECGMLNAFDDNEYVIPFNCELIIL